MVLRVNGVKGTYEAPKEAEWGNGKGKATWKAPDDKTGYYDVILYKGSTVMKKLEDYNGTSYNFYPYMTKEGDYTFLRYAQLFLILMSRNAMERK